IAGDKPSIESKSGLSIISKNCLAYAESDSTYLRCPSAYIVSNASVDLPEPERPVIVTSLFFGMSKLMFFKLCSLAPRIINLSFICYLFLHLCKLVTIFNCTLKVKLFGKSFHGCFCLNCILEQIMVRHVF